MQDVVASTDGATLLRVDLTPGADDDRFPDGFNRWRECITARVKAPPQDGEANRALVGLVADHFDLGSDEVWIKSGQTSRRKTLALAGLAVEEVRQHLSEVLPA